MKRSPEREQVKPGKRLKAFRKAREQTKWELMEAAHASANEHWPEYLWPDGNDDAWFHRKSAVSDLVEKQGQFSHHVATLALTDSDWETKEAVAAWLRSELKLLREAEAKPGAAPVRRGKALSRTQISDIAIELLECIGGECLVCLFQELLDVDRHRKSLSENFSQLEKGAEIEAQTQLQGRPMGVRELAHRLGVSPSTVTRWRRSRSFEKRVEMHKHVWRMLLEEEYFDQIKKNFPRASEPECFRHAFEMYCESLPARRAG